MVTKIYNIPIQAPEALALQFINLICEAKGFEVKLTEETFNQETMLSEVKDLGLTEDDIFQKKLDYVGLIAGKHLREIAEEQLKQKMLKQINEQSAEIASAFVVKSVSVEEAKI